MATTVILGGASSGKTRHAQALAETFAGFADQRWYYVATARLWDEEMRAKAAAHQQERQAGKVAWQTQEIECALADFLIGRKSYDVVLVDSMGMWLSNILCDEKNVDQAQKQLLTALHSCVASVFLVADEVGMGIVPEYRLSRTFRVANGLLNQALCAQAKRVDFVRAGLVQCLK